MKKITTIMMALMMVLTLTQCKKQTDDNDNNPDGSKVKVSCVVPMNNGGKSDFTNLMEDGAVNWSDGLEYVYVAIPGANPKIIELVSQSNGNQPKLLFEGNVTDGLITDGAEYEVWYFGHSKQLSVPYYSLENENKITGSIASQSGSINDLGYCHIAMTTVTAETVDGEVKLNLNGTLKNQIAIAFLDLSNATELYGNAIKGTEYSLQYNEETEKYDFVVTTDNNATISVESGTATSYVVLFPYDTNNEAKIKCLKNEKTYAYSFFSGVKANRIYFNTGNDGITPEPLTWKEIYEINGYEYVDLGLPSGLKWATCNVGANAPEEYGNYYAWGETTTKDTYIEDNCVTYGLSNSQLLSQGYIDGDGNLTPSYDAATANWGGSWRMPTITEMEELVENCTWTWTTQNGINGYKVTGTNGNNIFLPAAGYRWESSLYYEGRLGYYLSSTPYDSYYDYYACYLFFNNGGEYVYTSYHRGDGLTVRPVSE